MDTTKTMRFAADECPKCEGTGTVGPDLGNQVPCDATGDFDEWYCEDGQMVTEKETTTEHVGPCVECERPLDYDSKTDRYIHSDDPTVGCWLHAGVEKETTTKENYVVKQDTDGFFYSFTRHGIVENRVTDDGFHTMRDATYHLMDLIEAGSIPGGRITLV